MLKMFSQNCQQENLIETKEGTVDINVFPFISHTSRPICQNIQQNARPWIFKYFQIFISRNFHRNSFMTLWINLKNSEPCWDKINALVHSPEKENLLAENREMTFSPLLGLHHPKPYLVSTTRWHLLFQHILFPIPIALLSHRY